MRAWRTAAPGKRSDRILPDAVQAKAEDDARTTNETDHDPPDHPPDTGPGDETDHPGSDPARARAAQFPMKRTARDESTLDVSPLIRTIQYLDEVLKRGVVIGVYENSREVSDEDITTALAAVRAEMRKTTEAMEQSLRAVARVTGVHEAPGALQ